MTMRPIRWTATLLDAPDAGRSADVLAAAAHSASDRPSLPCVTVSLRRSVCSGNYDEEYDYLFKVVLIGDSGVGE